MDEIRILLVDDDEEELTVTRAMLRKIEHQNYIIDWCPDPAAALEKMAAGGYSVCLVDYNLGATNGLDLIRESIDRGCSGLPVILMTGQGNHAIDLEAMKLGATDYLNKGTINGEILERSIRYSIERKKAEEKLREMSLRDGLTGLANRRYFDEVLERELRRCHRESKPLSLILMDIDYFKPYNDTYGHLQGDRCLQQVSDAVAACVKRPGDLAARYGGEELAVILPETGLEDAAGIAEEMRLAVKSLCIPHGGSKVEDCTGVTVSAGVAAMNEEKPLASAGLIMRADKGLYEAKAEGRDRVVSNGEFERLS